MNPRPPDMRQTETHPTEKGTSESGAPASEGSSGDSVATTPPASFGAASPASPSPAGAALDREPDQVLNSFLAKQFGCARRLHEESNLVDVHPLPPSGQPFPQFYALHFSSVGLVRDADGEIREHNSHVVAVHFNDDYLRRVNPYEVARWCKPRDIWAPNIDGRGVICLGAIPPGLGIIELARQIHEIITYQRFASHDALNRHAANWARDRIGQFPVDPRGLFGTQFEFAVEGGCEEHLGGDSA